jgi:hypothetical protein
LDGGMWHHAIVWVNVELDASPECAEALQRMKLEPRVFQRSPERLDH